MGVVAAMLAVIVLVVLMFTGGMTDEGLMGVTVLVAVFLIPAVPLVLEGYRREVVLDEDGISARGWWGPVGEFAWNEITKVEWAQMGEKYIVRAGKQKISLNGYLEGLGAFEQICQEKLDPVVYGKAFAGPQAANNPAVAKKPAPAKPVPPKPAAVNDNPFDFADEPAPPKPTAKPKRTPVDDDE